MLAIIPARSGSKGIPFKNIKILHGKPLIVWTIESALKAKNVDRIIISTDDEDIANVCKDTGVEIPFMRPKELSKDNSLAIDNYIYTIERLNTDFNSNYKEFIVLLPTSPLRNSIDIDGAIELFYKKKADSVISCVEMSHAPLWAKKICKNGKIENYFNIEIDNKNRQELEPAYIPNGSIFIFKYSLLKGKYTYYSEDTYAYIMPKERSIDIDSISDFNYVDYLMSRR